MPSREGLPDAAKMEQDVFITRFTLPFKIEIEPSGRCTLMETIDLGGRQLSVSMKSPLTEELFETPLKVP